MTIIKASAAILFTEPYRKCWQKRFKTLQEGSKFCKTRFTLKFQIDNEGATALGVCCACCWELHQPCGVVLLQLIILSSDVVLCHPLPNSRIGGPAAGTDKRDLASSHSFYLTSFPTLLLPSPLPSPSLFPSTSWLTSSCS